MNYDLEVGLRKYDLEDAPDMCSNSDTITVSISLFPNQEGVLYASASLIYI